MKSTIIRILLTLLFLAVFNTLFFLLVGTENPTSVWLSYGFVHLAYLTMILLPALGPKGNESFYLSGTVFVQGLAYFLIELAVGVTFIILRQETLTWALLAQALLWFIFMVIILANAWANESTSRSLKKRQDDLQQSLSARMELKKLSAMTSDAGLKHAIISCYDLLTASSSRQTQQSAHLDLEIAQLTRELKQSIMDGTLDRSTTLVEKIKVTIQERNASLKYSY